MQREILKFQANTPITVQLDKGPEGKETAGKFGVEYQYTANANSAVFWLPPTGRAALLRSGAQAGDSVRITKSFRGDAAVFEAQLVSDASDARQQQPPAGIRMHAGGNSYDFQPHANGQPNHENDPHARQQNGNGHANGAAKPQPRPAVAASGPTGKHLALCLRAAIDAVAEAQLYAHEKGLGITFLGSDIRAIANSIYINDQQNGGER